MIRYITRHGQTPTTEEYLATHDGHMYPAGDSPISELGRYQATQLGKRMRELNFHGLIVASPYARALETAECIAAETGCTVLPYPPIREIFKNMAQTEVFHGLTTEGVRAICPHADPEIELPYPWWTCEVETEDEVLERIRGAIADIEARFPDREILYVGHGASAGALLKAYEIPRNPEMRMMLFNCSLSAIDPMDPTVPTLYCTTDHLPYEKTTSNYLTREAYDREFFERSWAHSLPIPPEAMESGGTRILHIGDTRSREYPFYLAVIRALKPDVIIHTGDTADEVKVGRILGTEYEYITKVSYLLDEMDRSGARLIFVPGNNDLPGELGRMLPRMEILPKGGTVTIGGAEITLAHDPRNLDFTAPLTLFGHTLKHDRRIPAPISGGPLAHNANWGIALFIPETGKLWNIPRPSYK